MIPTDTERLNWLDLHCAFVADGEYRIGPYNVGELRKMADDGIEADRVRSLKQKEHEEMLEQIKEDPPWQDV